MSRNDGGAAFPALQASERWENRDGGHSYSHESAGGMSLRDYFAAAAMQGICSQWRFPGNEREHLAEESYKVADAMLAERAR